ncbi:H-NS family nucleoid-associated regulatory protein [uncultured Aquabacterium sp.]|uniref:H-NS family nucleoid-associated regulatory protein n=1 Tax=Aquabacterium sp. TaxID=1872578 RepID=UPI0025E2B9C0|nr:H-NS family nucleoid-associated regulatory protein [uncultured Aquabacterium sp.]
MMTPEQEAVLRAVRKLVDFWHITPGELLADGPIAVPPAAPSPPPVPRPKYRHPVNGETWDGTGSQPQWLKDALTREGYTVEELRTPAEAGPD